DPAIDHQPDRRAHDAARVEAAVLVEAPVLDRDERLRHVRRQVLERDLRSALLTQLLDQDSIVAEDLGRLRRLPDVDLGDRRAIVADVAPRPERYPAAQSDQREQDDHHRSGQARVIANSGETGLLAGDGRHRLFVQGGRGSGVVALLHGKLATRFPEAEEARRPGPRMSDPDRARTTELEYFVRTPRGARSQIQEVAMASRTPIRSSSPWDALRDMREQMDALLRATLRGPNGHVAEFEPAVDITESDDALVLTAELPGMRREDVSVELENNVLTIRGEKKEEREQKGEE